VEGSTKPSVTYEPFYILNLEIPRDAGDLQACLKSFFEEKRILDYMHNGKRVRATHKSLISKLPRILCLHLKRFIYTDRLIKMKDYVTFDEVIDIKDEFLANQLRIGC
jgi:ubiquitin C-terminal hydrolase